MDEIREERNYYREMYQQYKEKYEEEKSIVDRIWKALGISALEEAKGKEISEIVAGLKAKIDKIEKQEAEQTLFSKRAKFTGEPVTDAYIDAVFAKDDWYCKTLHDLVIANERVRQLEDALKKCQINAFTLNEIDTHNKASVADLIYKTAKETLEATSEKPSRHLVEVLNNLPFTADGIKVIPGFDYVWTMDGEYRLVGLTEEGCRAIQSPNKSSSSTGIPIFQCFSTLEAAQSAKKEKEERHAKWKK